MHCEHYAELLSGFVDGRLTEGQTNMVLTHVDGCDSCRGDLETLFAIGDSLRHGNVFNDTHEPSPDFVARVMEQVPAAPVIGEPAYRPSMARRYFNAFIESLQLRPAFAGAAATAALVIMVGGATYIYSTLSKPELMQVTEIKPHSATSVAELEDREFYNHARLDAAYTVGGTPLQINHPTAERF